MKIRLKSTKLSDENKKPIMFFHSTPCEKIEFFLPLSHFGTRKAAQMRSIHFVYKALGIPAPLKMPEEVPTHLIQKLNQLQNIPKFKIFSVYLAMKSPVHMPDIVHHSVEQYYRWFSRRYVPKSQYLTPQERCEGDVIGPARIKYKGIMSEFLFLDPFTRSEDELRKELTAESFYAVPEKLSIPEYIPSFLSPILSKTDKKLYFLAEKVALQRMMRYLESEGHDGFVYQNECEDKGQKSYIIFRPEQVFHPSEKVNEHIVPEKTTEQKSFLQDVETKFFKAHGTLSPSQRKENYLQRKLEAHCLRIPTLS